MANVLPLAGKKAVEKRMRARFLLIGSLAIAVAAIVAILSVVPAFMSVRIAHASLESSLQESAGSQSEDQAAAARAQALIGAFKSIASATSSPSDALAAALAQKPAGISITAITYTSGKNEIVLSGLAARREAVNQFRDMLEKTGRFSGVAVPVGALVGTQEGRFTVTLSGAF